jgi:hypothetical protein
MSETITAMSQLINLSVLSSKFDAYQRCIETNNKEWEENHRGAIEEILKALPSGSGIDDGVKFNWNHSTPQKLVFTFGFHHLNEGGFYDGWTNHILTITPKFGGYDLKISGPNKNHIKDYLYDVFYSIFK